MTDMNDTKPLPETTPKDAPPDTTEGEEMPITLESLNLRVSILDVEVRAIKQRFDDLLTPQQITDMIKTAIDGSVVRVENLVNTIAEMVGDNVFDSSRIDSIDEKLATRATNAAISDRKLDLVIEFINRLAADDVTNPDAKKSGKSWFERMEESIKTSDERSLSSVVEVSQVRIDAAEYMHSLKDGIETVNAIAAELRPLALSVARAQSLVDIGLRLAKRPRLAFGLFVAAFAAFGGATVLTPEVVKLIGGVVVSFFTGAN